MTAEAAPVEVIRQHLIDPEICIRCNTCEETCPVDAITHDSRNYVVDAAKCNGCNACISPCPTGSIDNWRQVARTRAYTLDEQFAWDALPAQEDPGTGAAPEIPQDIARITAEASAGQGGAVAAPWSAAHPYVNLHTIANPALATVSGNFALTAAGASSDIRHIVHRLRRDGVSGPRRTDDRHRPARNRRAGTAAPRPAVFGREPARRGAPGLQQRRADGQARHRGSRRQRGRGRRVELSLRSRQGRHRRSRRAVRHQLPHAEPSGFEPAHDLHGNGLGADARHDGAAPPSHRTE